MSKDKSRDYASDLKNKARPPEARVVVPEGLQPTVEVVDDVDAAALGLTIFDAEATGDIRPFDRAAFAARLKSGYEMIERFMALKPGDECPCWLLGWSYALIPDPQDSTKHRVMRKMHLELTSGARVSMLEASQLAGVFALPMDGGTHLVIVRGDKTERPGGRTMTNWGVEVALGKRAPTHESGKAYAQTAGAAAFVYALQHMTSTELLRVDGAPPGLLEPYLEDARKRELDAEIAKRADAAARATA